MCRPLRVSAKFILRLLDSTTATMTDRRTTRITTTRTASTTDAITAIESPPPVDGILLSVDITCSVDRTLSTDGLGRLKGTNSITVESSITLSVSTDLGVDSVDSDSVDIGPVTLVTGSERTEVGCSVSEMALGIDDELRTTSGITLLVVGDGGGVGTI